MKKSLLLAAGVFALAACATPHKDVRTMATCTASPCPLLVVVRDCRHVKTNPYQLDIPPGNTNDIVWTISGSSEWTFTRNGVEFKSGHGAGFAPGGGGGSRTFRYHNNHSKLGPHEYNVNVTPDGGRTVCTEDPTIVNH